MVKKGRYMVPRRVLFSKTCCTSQSLTYWWNLAKTLWHNVSQVETGSPRLDTRWLTRCQVVFTLNVISTVWPTAPCHRSATHTTTVLLTRRASSTHTTLRWSPSRPILSQTTTGSGAVPHSPSSLEWHQITNLCVAKHVCRLRFSTVTPLSTALYCWNSILFNIIISAALDVMKLIFAVLNVSLGDGPYRLL